MVYDCARCYVRLERASIVEYEGGINRITAEEIARRDVCWNCPGEYGVELAALVPYSLPQLQLFEIDV